MKFTLLDSLESVSLLAWSEAITKEESFILKSSGGPLATRNVQFVLFIFILGSTTSWPQVQRDLFQSTYGNASVRRRSRTIWTQSFFKQ